MADKIYDILIVGSGPAGLTAAVYARRAGKSVLVLEKEVFGGQITHSPKVENYPGYLEMSGNEFAEKLMEQAQVQGAEIDLAEVTDVTVDDSGIKHVMTDMGEYLCKALIIASGSRHRELGVPREEEFTGKGISYCAVCDGAFFQGEPVAVNGGGNSALQDAMLLSEICSRVYVVHRRDSFRGEEKLVEALSGKDNVEFVLNARVTKLHGEDELTGITVEQNGTERELKVSGLFVAIGHEPDIGAFAGLMNLDKKGYAASGEDCLTATEGLFVAGDCRSKAVHQLTTAVADGAVAALAACSWLDRNV